MRQKEIQSTELFHRKKDLHLLTLWMTMISFMVLVRRIEELIREVTVISVIAQMTRNIQKINALYMRHIILLL